MGRSDKKVFDEVFLLGFHPRHPTSTTALYAIGSGRQTLDITLSRDSDHHILFGNQVLNIKFLRRIDDFGAPLVTKALGNLIDLILDDLQLPLLAGEDAPEIFNNTHQLLVFGFDLFALQSRQAL